MLAIGQFLSLCSLVPRLNHRIHSCLQKKRNINIFALAFSTMAVMKRLSTNTCYGHFGSLGLNYYITHHVRDTYIMTYIVPCNSALSTVTITAIDHLWGLGYYEGAPCSVQHSQTQRRAWRPLLKTGQ